MDDLKNYCPISLINIDLKILTKTLTTHLKKVLPSGIGPAFIHWICQIYSNATTRVQVNGFLSENIPRRKAGVPFKPSSLRPHY